MNHRTFFFTVLLAAILVFGCTTYQDHIPDEPHTHSWDKPSVYPDRIALTWSDDPATSLSVTWRTDSTVTEAYALFAKATPSPRFDRYADTLAAATELLDTRLVVGEETVAHFHSVTFRDLEPNTLYAYRVGSEGVWTEWYQFRTASSDTEPFSFLYFGDAQNDLHTHWSRLIREAYSRAPDARFMIHAGDLVNSAHRNIEWGEWFEAGGWIHGMLPSIPVPGNHEYRAYHPDSTERFLSVHWRPQFTLPENGIPGLEETVYYIDYQGVRVIGLNSMRDIQQQAEWLETVLSDNPNRWTVITFHFPIYSSSGNRDNPALRSLWKPIFDRHYVDLVVQGHDHTYARGQVENVATGVNGQDQSAGTVYVNSVSGPKMYTLKELRWSEYEATLERAAENTQLFQVIHVTQDTLHYEAFTVTGELYDQFDIVKKENAPNVLIERIPSGIPERTHENTIPYR